MTTYSNYKSREKRLCGRWSCWRQATPSHIGVVDILSRYPKVTVHTRDGRKVQWKKVR